MSELKLGYFTRGQKGMDPNSFTKFYTYALASFAFGGVDSITNKLDQELTFPFAPLKPIIEEILKDQDFKLITNLKDEDWTNKAISICSLEDDGESLRPFESKATTSYKGLVNNLAIYPMWSVVDDGSGTLRPKPDDGIAIPPAGWSTPRYYPPTGSNVTIRLSFTNRAAISQVMISLLKHNENDNINKNEYLIPLGRYSSSFEKVLETNIVDGDYIQIVYTLYGGNNILDPPQKTYDFTSASEFTPTMIGYVPVGGKVNISKNLGFDRQLDLFNAFAQLYGLTISVDNIKRVVYAYTFDKIIDNKTIARDWSNKLDVKKRPEQEFSFGNYAQHNKISLIDNDRDFVQDFAVFQVRNESKQDQKDLFSIKFEAGKNLMMEIQGANTTKIFANVPLVENNFENGKITKSEFKKGKPHLVELSSETIQVIVDDKNYQYKIAHHPRVRQFINQYYSALVNNVLYQSKVITAYFLLTEQDIEEFDQYIPVYVDYFGYYFYVNKIVNYGATYLTECELIKI